MILTKRFWRYVDEETVFGIHEALASRIPLCGVFVDEPVSVVKSYLDQGLIDLVQLHGSESNTHIRELRTCHPETKIIKAFQIRNESDLNGALESEADFVLLDGGTGTGQAFNWKLIGSFSRPYLLAGGLSPENVKDAVLANHPYGVDTSSGVETDRVKDPTRIKDFIHAVKEADNHE